MSSTSRSKNTSVIQHLENNSGEYSFLQVVRLLEQAHIFNSVLNNKDRAYPVAQFVRPENEIIRFHTNQKLEFYSSEIESIVSNNKTRQKHVVVNIMGLSGSMGVLPYHYSELILLRQKLKDKSLSTFLDLFNHRSISLFYQASVKYRLPIEYERTKQHADSIKAKDNHTKVLLSLIGLGTKHLDNRLYTKDESLLYYSGLLSHEIKTAISLKRMLQRHFEIPVQINEFVGQWQYLIDDVRTRLSSKSNPKGQNASLGHSAIIGKKGWFAQGKIQIILGILNKEQLHRFAPGTQSFKALNEIVRLYVGLECNYNFVIRVKRKHLPNKIILNKNNPPVISWNTWLPQSKKSYNPEEIVDIIVSPARINMKLIERNSNDHN